MLETRVVKLHQPPLVTPSTGSAGGGCLIVFGLPFLALGSWLAWTAYAHIDRLDLSSTPMPRVFLYMLAGVFASAGLLVCGRGAAGILESARTERRMRANPDEPWWGDHRWKPAGQREHPFLGLIGGLLFVAFLAAFFAPFHWWMAVEPWIPGYFVLGLFDLIVLGITGAWLYGVARAFKYGAGWIRYDRFPFFLGETLDVRIGCRGALTRLDTLTVTVRHVRVRKESRDNSTAAVAYQHWAKTFTVDPRSLADPKELPVTLPLPSGDFGSWLSDDPPRYWEIETTGLAPGIDFKSRFLLPVYSRNGR